ncbi:MAG: nucleoside 2-deoxyribosyltransferase domain-containing protein [Clostridia bacterium]|nr:nucleoside 2-deoxyribosyltransferase domain-containing protein [Clostridia bacterium]
MVERYYEDKKIDTTKKSIFLAGPTPRSNDTESWRPEAIRILKELGFNGEVFIPEFKTEVMQDLEYPQIIEWELEHLDKASIICFWVPRKLDTMPAFTTNVEFGYHLKTGKVVYGRPDTAPKNRYLDYLYTREYQKQPFSNLKFMLKEIVDLLN